MQTGIEFNLISAVFNPDLQIRSADRATLFRTHQALYLGSADERAAQAQSIMRDLKRSPKKINLTSDTLYAALNYADLALPENQMILINLIKRNARVRDFILSDIFGAPTIVSKARLQWTDNSHFSFQELDDNVLMYHLGLAVFNEYKQDPSQWMTLPENTAKMNEILIRVVHQKINSITEAARISLKDKLSHDITFAYNFFSYWDAKNIAIPPKALRAYASVNPGAALAILNNPLLRHELLTQLQPEDMLPLLQNAAAQQEAPTRVHYFRMTLDLLLKHGPQPLKEKITADLKEALDTETPRNTAIRREVLTVDPANPRTDIAYDIFEKHFEVFVRLVSNHKQMHLSTLLFHAKDPVALLRRLIEHSFRENTGESKTLRTAIIYQSIIIVIKFFDEHANGNYKKSSLGDMIDLIKPFVKQLFEEKTCTGNTFFSNQVNALFEKPELIDKFDFKEQELRLLFPQVNNQSVPPEIKAFINKNCPDAKENPERKKIWFYTIRRALNKFLGWGKETFRRAASLPPKTSNPFASFFNSASATQITLQLKRHRKTKSLSDIPTNTHSIPKTAHQTRMKRSTSLSSMVTSPQPTLAELYAETSKRDELPFRPKK